MMYNIDYCGYNTHNPDQDIIYRPNGSASYLLLLIHSPMTFEVGQDELLVKQGGCMLYTPGFPQRYYAVREFVNSYVHFFAEDELLLPYSFPRNQIFYPDNTDEINWYMKKLHKEYLTKPLHYQEQIHALIQQLMIHIDRDYQHGGEAEAADSSLYSAFQSLRLQMLSYCEEDWPIERMCKLVNLEKSQVYSYYKKFFHISPKTELLNARIDKAKFLLTNEALQVNQVAQASGFSDIYHFSRYFKKYCGCAPSRFTGERELPTK